MASWDRPRVPLEVRETESGYEAEATLWGAGGLDWIGRGPTAQEAAQDAVRQMDEWLLAAQNAAEAVRMALRERG